jgi:transposase
MRTPKRQGALGAAFRGPPAGRGGRQADGLRLDRRSALRDYGLQAADGPGPVRRSGRGRPKTRPHRVSCDKAYGTKQIRRYLRRRGIRTTISRTKNEHTAESFDREICWTRNRIERQINRLKERRRVATRYETQTENYQAMLTIAAIMLWS